MTHLIRTSNMTTRANRQSHAAGLTPAGLAALQAKPQAAQQFLEVRASERKTDDIFCMHHTAERTANAMGIARKGIKGRPGAGYASKGNVVRGFLR